MDASTTSAPLLAAARELFADRGFAEARLEEIQERAGVSRDQLSRLFPGGKEELFRAVAVRVSAETAQRVRLAAREATTPWEALERGVAAFLDASATPEVRRILLRDGPAVLGTEVWRAIDGDYAIALLDRVLEKAIEAGQLPRQPTRPAAHVVLGALEEAAMTVACADDPLAARAEMGRTVERLLVGLRTPIG